MKIRNIAVGIVVGGVIFAVGVAAVAWQKERLGRHRAIRHAQGPQAGTGTLAAQVVSESL